VCPKGETHCVAEPIQPFCANLNTDPESCGACFKACLPGEPGEACLSGTCGCPDGGTLCQNRSGVDACTDVLNGDPEHCGECNRRCGTIGGPVDCVNGECVCLGERIFCESADLNGACVDARNDPFNCGQCDNQCGPDQNCVEGECVCPGGLTFCAFSFPVDGSGCVDLQNDRFNCGGCDAPCHNDQFCQGGACMCAAEGFGICSDSGGDPRCRDLRSDEDCGFCGNVCVPGTSCQQGQTTEFECLPNR
jgi:hypothetical protein